MSDVDILAIGAHPDDVELTIGGTLAKATASGRRVAILDLTRGEMGSRGTPETRAAEAAAAAKILGVVERINLDLGDGDVRDTAENRRALIEVIRRLRPRIVMAHYWDDLHPDHVGCGLLVKNVMYPSGFARFPAKGVPFRPNEYLFYMSHTPVPPSLVVDVSEHIETKRAAIRCFGSQLNSPGSEEPPTLLSRSDLWDRIEARARYFGALIDRPFGEPFHLCRPLPVVDPVTLFEPFPREASVPPGAEPDPRDGVAVLTDSPKPKSAPAKSKGGKV